MSTEDFTAVFSGLKYYVVYHETNMLLFNAFSLTLLIQGM